MSHQLVHISDWLPTFAKLAGVNIDGPIDGKNVWNALSYNLPSPRRQLLCHHDAGVPYMSFIQDNFKIVTGSTYNGTYDGWLSDPIDPSEANSTFATHYSEIVLNSDVGKALLKHVDSNKCKAEHFVGIRSRGITESEVTNIRQQAQITCNGYTPPINTSVTSCNPVEAPCLFDILNDPCETTNLALEFPEVIRKLQAKLNYYGSIAKPPRNKPADPRCNPANFGNIWTWWYDELNITSTASGKIF